MKDFVPVVFGDQIVGDAKALEAFELLVPMLQSCPGDPEAVDAAAKIVQLMPDPSVASSVLDWWLMVTTGHKSANGHAYALPDEIGDELRAAMEALRDIHTAVPAAQWVRARRDRVAALDRIDERLDLESYGAVKLQGERSAWASLLDELHPILDRLRDGDPDVTVSLDEEAFAKAMRASGLDENSRRWREMQKRARAACAAIGDLARLTAVVRPREHPERLQLSSSVPGAIEQALGELTGSMLAPALDPELFAPTPASSIESVAEHLAEAAAGTDQEGLLRLADIADSWLGHTGARVEALEGSIALLADLRARAARLEDQGVDVDEVQLLLLDYQVDAAAEALKVMEEAERSKQRASQLEQRYESFLQTLSGELLLDEPEWASRLDEIKSALDRYDTESAERLLSEADHQSRSVLRERRLQRLREALIDLERLDAPPGVLFELEEEIAQLDEDSERGVSLARLDEVAGLLEEARNDRLQLATQLLDDLASREPDSLPADLRLALVTGLAEMTEQIDRYQDADTIALVVEQASDLLNEANRRQVASWRAEHGEDALVQHLVDYCQERMDYSETDIRRLYVAMKTKPFVIIAGLTGTGKSSIARLLAESMGATVANGQFRRIAVRPDWIDQSEVLGFVNPTSHRFEPGWLAEVIRSCQRQPDRLFFVLLDEMNLAPVEQYLAEILSAMEEARAGSLDVRIPLYSRGLSPENASEWSAEVRYPPNLVLIGTVNVDETTRPLSDRVLDRANVLQLSMQWSTRHHDPRTPEIQPRIVPFPEWRQVCESAPSDAHHDFLVDVAEHLESVGIGLGLRSHLEVERFLANAEGVLDEVVALDIALLQRVIPKIRGFKRDVAPGLTELRGDLEATGCRTCVAVLDRWLVPSVSDDEFLDGTDARIGLVSVGGSA